MESSSPNYRTHLEAFRDSQDLYDIWQIRKDDKTIDPLETIMVDYYSQECMYFDRILFSQPDKFPDRLQTYELIDS